MLSRELAVAATSTTRSTPSGAISRWRRRVLVAVVDHMMRARGRRERRLGGAGDGCDDGGAGPSRELDGSMTHRTRPAGDQHDLAGEGTGMQPAGPSSDTVRARCAVMAGTPRLAPMSKLVPPGSRTTRSAGRFVYSCAVPVGRCGRPDRPRPISHRQVPTPSPTASMTPEPSWFGVTSGNGGAHRRQNQGGTSSRWG